MCDARSCKLSDHIRVRDFSIKGDFNIKHNAACSRAHADNYLIDRGVVWGIGYLRAHFVSP